MAEQKLSTKVWQRLVEPYFEHDRLIRKRWRKLIEGKWDECKLISEEIEKIEALFAQVIEDRPERDSDDPGFKGVRWDGKD